MLEKKQKNFFLVFINIIIPYKFIHNMIYTYKYLVLLFIKDKAKKDEKHDVPYKIRNIMGFCTYL